MSLTPKTMQWIAFGFSVFVGALVWIASPYFTGQREPWDSMSFLLIGGAIAGLLAPRRLWLWAVGIWLGQMIGFNHCFSTLSNGDSFGSGDGLASNRGSMFGHGMGKPVRKFGMFWMKCQKLQNSIEKIFVTHQPNVGS